MCPNKIENIHKYSLQTITKPIIKEYKPNFTLVNERIKQLESIQQNIRELITIITQGINEIVNSL